MIRSRHFAAAAGVSLLLLVIVFVTIFGSAAFVTRLAETDSEDLARSWLASLDSVFELPGTPAPAQPDVIDLLIQQVMANNTGKTDDTVDVFNPDRFEAQEHFGSIIGYAVFTRFGQLTIAGGKPQVRDIERADIGAAFAEVLVRRKSTIVPLNADIANQNPCLAVLIPLERGGRVTGVVSIEVERERFETVVKQGVQLMTLATALSVGVVALVGLGILYSWGRAALKAQREASFLASTDPVTLLPNRRRFNEALPEVLKEADKKHCEIAVAFSDVDNFKDVNDTFGHSVGDRMLTEIGQRLKTILKPGDQIFRISGDHFAMILGISDGSREIDVICEQIQSAMRGPLLAEEYGQKLSISTGVARYPLDAADAEQLAQAADLALYQAKAEGRRTYRHFTRNLNAEALDYVRLRRDLEDALAQNQLHLAYQPQVDAVRGQLIGFEALARWNHPTEGPISPVRFIPVAEQSGLIRQLGEWALREACNEARKWPDALRVAVNLSPAQLRDLRLSGVVKKVLKETGLAPQRLELEVTESVMMQDMMVTGEAFTALRALGVGIAIDDFGTGYSSLSYLTRLPVTKLKIDRSFVERYGANERDDVVVSALIRLAADLGLETTAEGVQEEEQAVLLKRAGCRSMQGYYFGEPTPDPMAVISAWRVVPVNDDEALRA